MAKEVILTSLAERTYENVVEYLLSNWGVMATNNFIERFEQINNRLVETPEIFPFLDKIKRVQKCVLTNTIYYI